MDIFVFSGITKNDGMWDQTVWKYNLILQEWTKLDK